MPRADLRRSRISPAESTTVDRQYWQGNASIRFHRSRGRTVHQGGCTAPLKLSRAVAHGNTCELSLLHTAGGLVGGDVLHIDCRLAPHSRALLTSVAAQKVYGSVGRSRLQPEGAWARQRLTCQVEDGAWLSWFPQETVVFSNGLLQQEQRVELRGSGAWLGVEVVRLGRTAADETIGRGCWRSRLELWRGQRLLLGDPMALNGASRQRLHGLAGQAVVGMLNWAGGLRLDAPALDACRQARGDLSGEMEVGVIHDDEGDLLCCRYRGDSTQAARCWFVRIWALIHRWQGGPPPVLPRVWPLQDPLLPPGAIQA
ncbi:MAG: urease accessory protein UreD [Synechococcus sp. SB0677_bin_5]|nr:urease accessory protein UreD [Synechococcus sp. SB0677_bin_5]